ncbi:MarR family winged helix-turn-helix transcriptional regulator [Geodermatophilus sp. SYSU D00815]
MAASAPPTPTGVWSGRSRPGTSPSPGELHGCPGRRPSRLLTRTKHAADERGAGLANGSLIRLSRTVDRLERRGWVTRRPDPDDGRSTLAVLTDAGWDEVVATAPGHVAEVRRLAFDLADRAPGAPAARDRQPDPSDRPPRRLPLRTCRGRPPRDRGAGPPGAERGRESSHPMGSVSQTRNVAAVRTPAGTLVNNWAKVLPDEWGALFTGCALKQGAPDRTGDQLSFAPARPLDARCRAARPVGWTWWGRRPPGPRRSPSESGCSRTWSSRSSRTLRGRREDGLSSARRLRPVTPARSSRWFPPPGRQSAVA